MSNANFDFLDIKEISPKTNGLRVTNFYLIQPHEYTVKNTTPQSDKKNFSQQYIAE